MRYFQRGLVRDIRMYVGAIERIFKEHSRVRVNFYGMLMDWKNKRIAVCQAVLRMACLFRRYPRLMEAFNIFLPLGYLIKVGGSGHVYLQVPATAMLDECETDADRMECGLKQNYITILQPEHVDALLERHFVRGMHYLLCKRHRIPHRPERMKQLNFMCPGCYKKHLMSRSIEDFERFVHYVKSELLQQPRLFDTFVDYLKEYQSQRMSLLDLSQNVVDLLRDRLDLFYEFHTYLIGDKHLILRTERVRIHVNAFIVPVQIGTVEIVISSTPNEETDDFPHINDQESTVVVDPLYSGQLQRETGELNEVQQIGSSSFSQRQTKSPATNRTIAYPYVRLPKRRRSVRLGQNLRKSKKSKENIQPQQHDSTKAEGIIEQPTRQSTKHVFSKVLSPTDNLPQQKDENCIELENSIRHESSNAKRNKQALKSSGQSRKKKPISLARSLLSTIPDTVGANKKSTTSSNGCLYIDEQSSSITGHRITKKYSSTTSRHPHKQKPASTKRHSLIKQQPASTRGRRHAEQQPASTKGRGPTKQQPASTKGRGPTKQQPASTRRCHPTKQQSASTKACRPTKQQSASTKARRPTKQQSASTKARRPAKQQSASTKGRHPAEKQPAPARRHHPAKQKSVSTRRRHTAIQQPASISGRPPAKQQSVSTKVRRSVSQQSNNSTELVHSVSEQPINLTRIRNSLKQQLKASRSLQVNTSTSLPVNQETRRSTRIRPSVTQEQTSVSQQSLSSRGRRSVNQRSIPTRVLPSDIHSTPTKGRQSVSQHSTPTRRRRSVSQQSIPARELCSDSQLSIPTRRRRSVSQQSIPARELCPDSQLSIPTRGCHSISQQTIPTRGRLSIRQLSVSSTDQHSVSEQPINLTRTSKSLRQQLNASTARQINTSSNLPVCQQPRRSSRVRPSVTHEPFRSTRARRSIRQQPKSKVNNL